MRTNKQGFAICDLCERPALDGVIRLSYHETLDSPAEQDLAFCSKRCFDEYLEDQFLAAVNRRVVRETNEIYKLVCPACKDRVRRHAK